eukprot:m.142940 g.142940  ORF g.142940 m.142940 type:complete len:313 (+) comp20418_c1_seq1:74-1012(+)
MGLSQRLEAVFGSAAGAAVAAPSSSALVEAEKAVLSTVAQRPASDHQTGFFFFSHNFFVKLKLLPRAEIVKNKASLAVAGTSAVLDGVLSLPLVLWRVNKQIQTDLPLSLKRLSGLVGMQAADVAYRTVERFLFDHVVRRISCHTAWLVAGRLLCKTVSAIVLAPACAPCLQLAVQMPLHLEPVSMWVRPLHPLAAFFLVRDFLEAVMSTAFASALPKTVFSKYEHVLLSSVCAEVLADTLCLAPQTSLLRHIRQGSPASSFLWSQVGWPRLHSVFLLVPESTVRLGGLVAASVGLKALHLHFVQHSRAKQG